LLAFEAQAQFGFAVLSGFQRGELGLDLEPISQPSQQHHQQDQGQIADRYGPAAWIVWIEIAQIGL